MKDKPAAIRVPLAVVVGIISGIIFTGLLVGAAKLVEFLLEFS